MLNEIEIKQNNLQGSEKLLVSGDGENMTTLEECVVIEPRGCWSQRGVVTHRSCRTWDVASRHASSITITYDG